MGFFFKDDLQDALTWAAGYIPYGGADLGEVRAVAETVGDGDAGEFNKAWVEAGDRLVERARAALAAGKRTTRARRVHTRQLPLRVIISPAFRKARRPPAARRVRQADRCIQRGICALRSARDALTNTVRRPIDAGVLPSGAKAREGSAPADDPNQRLRCHRYRYVLCFGSGGIPTRLPLPLLRWPRSGRDALRARRAHSARLGESDRAGSGLRAAVHEVDPKRIALMGWSFGGYLASRAVSGETRIAACIADPGLFGRSRAASADASTAWRVAGSGPRSRKRRRRHPRKARADATTRSASSLDNRAARILGSRGRYVTAIRCRDSIDIRLAGRVESIACTDVAHRGGKRSARSDGTKAF